MNKIAFHELARSEFLDARDYYDELAFGLGRLFVQEIERCLNTIRSNPLAYLVIKESIHKAVVIKFPYSILYEIEVGTVFILAVMHQKRKPYYWSTRE